MFASTPSTGAFNRQFGKVSYCCPARGLLRMTHHGQMAATFVSSVEIMLTHLWGNWQVSQVAKLATHNPNQHLK